MLSDAPTQCLRLEEGDQVGSAAQEPKDKDQRPGQHRDPRKATLLVLK